MKRILFFDASDQFGGAQCSILTSIELISTHYEVELLSASDELINRATKLCKTNSIVLSHWQRKLSNIYIAIRDCRRVRSFLKQNYYDLIMRWLLLVIIWRAIMEK